MKNFFLKAFQKAKEWVLAHSWGTNLQVLSAFLMFIGVIVFVMKPELGNALTRIVLLSFLSFIIGLIIKKQ